MGKQHKCVFQSIAGREASISPGQGTSLFLTQAGASSDGKGKTESTEKLLHLKKNTVYHKRAVVVYPKNSYRTGMSVKRFNFPMLNLYITYLGRYHCT